MVTIKSLQREIEKEKAKRSKIESKIAEQEKIRKLQLELKGLKKTPSQLRTERLIKRTGKGLKFIGKSVGTAALKQAKRIRDQQIRDLEASIRKERALRTKKKIRKTPKEDFLVGFPVDFGL